MTVLLYDNSASGNCYKVRLRVAAQPGMNPITA
jgi:hypothetical protein